MTENIDNNCICPVCGDKLGLEPLGVCVYCGFNILEDSFCVTQKLSDKEKERYSSLIQYKAKKEAEELERKRIINEAYRKSVEQKREEERIKAEKEKREKEKREKEKQERKKTERALLDTRIANLKSDDSKKNDTKGVDRYLEEYRSGEAKRRQDALKEKQDALKEKQDQLKLRKQLFLFGGLELFNLCMICFIALWLLLVLTDGVPAFIPEYSITHKYFFFMFVILCVNELINVIIMSRKEQDGAFLGRLFVAILILAEIVTIIVFLQDNYWLSFANNESLAKWIKRLFWIVSLLGIAINTWNSSEYYTSLPMRKMVDEISIKWNGIVSKSRLCLILSYVLLFILDIVIYFIF